MSLRRSLVIGVSVAAMGCHSRRTAVPHDASTASTEAPMQTLTLHLTDATVTALETFLGPGPIRRAEHPLRISVEEYKPGGFSYFFGFADDPKEPQYAIDKNRDVVIVVKGFPVAVMRHHVRYLQGVTIDYVESPTEGAGFKFDNPQGNLDDFVPRLRR